uniref:EP1-like protein n=1 Tax=Glyptapanteles indiensis TaxID=92994 RepID=A0JCY6_GLYIN|nr:EP1-like protein [Glyptapanteles indiensis]
MFSKVVVFVLATLIGTILGAASPTTQVDKEKRQVVQYLNCSVLTGNRIVISNTEFNDIESPCRINVSEIVLNNNVFPTFEKQFDISAENVTIINNLFYGSQQDHRIVGNQINLSRNIYAGQHQIHEVAGTSVMVAVNLYDGDYQVVKLMGNTIMEAGNKHTGNLVSHNLTAVTTEELFKEYSFELPSYLKNTVLESKAAMVTDNEFGGTHTNSLPSGSIVKYLLRVFSGLKIFRNFDAPILRQMSELYDQNV